MGVSPDGFGFRTGTVSSKPVVDLEAPGPVYGTLSGGSNSDSLVLRTEGPASANARPPKRGARVVGQRQTVVARTEPGEACPERLLSGLGREDDQSPSSAATAAAATRRW